MPTVLRQSGFRFFFFSEVLARARLARRVQGLKSVELKRATLLVIELGDWRLVGRGVGIHWPKLDEDLSVSGLLAPRMAGGRSPHD